MKTFTKQKLAYTSWYLAGTTINGLLMGTLLRKITKQFTLEDVGTIVAIATFSWCAKPLFGLMVDKWKNRYWWAMTASVAMVPLMIFLPLIGTDTVMACTIAMLLPTLVQTTRDTAVDALAIQTSTNEEREEIQVSMRNGFILGTAAGGSGAMYLMHNMHVSWAHVCWMAAALTFVSGVVVPLMLKNSLQGGESSEKASWQVMKETLKGKTIFLGLFLAALSIPAQAIAQENYFVWWDKYFPNRISEVYLGGILIQLPAVVVANKLVKKLGRTVAMRIALGFVICSYYAVSMTASFHDATAVIVLSYLTSCADAIWTVMLYSLLMDFADARFKAMSFGLFMAGYNLCYWLGGKYGAWIGDHLGSVSAFESGGRMQLLVLIPMLLIWWRKREESLTEEA